MRHGTIITAIALAALATGACANGPGGINGPAVDQVIEETHRDGTVFNAELTYAQPVGRHYVAFLTLEWGNPNVRVGRRGRTPTENFDGTVEVDDGVAHIIETLDFEGGRHNQRAARRIYENQVHVAERKREQFIRGAERQWQAQRNAAFNRYRSRRRLRRRGRVGVSDPRRHRRCGDPPGPRRPGNRDRHRSR
ncbi:MAG: hypothetical protein ACYTFO_05640 [Planctomycetota bacterium]|jgi:hypothetical protein